MDAAVEWELIARCRSGSARAYEPLVRRYERPALAFAIGLLGDVDDAEDAVQDAFVQAYRALGRLKEGSAFGPWFRTILRNLCLDRLRAVRTAKRTDWPPPGGRSVWGERLWSEPVGTGRIERLELAAGVRDALAELSAEHRAILALKELDGLGYAEIAASLAIPPGTVASRLHHARAALRRVLAAHGFTLEDIAP